MEMVAFGLPATILTLFGLPLVLLLMRRRSAARRHHALRVLLVTVCALPFLSPIFLFTPKVTVATVSATVVRDAPGWTPYNVLPFDDRRVRGTADDETPAMRRSRADFTTLYLVLNGLVMGLLTLSLLRATARLRRIVAGATPEPPFEGIEVLRATDASLGVPVQYGRTILLPKEAAEWPEARRRAALLHEAAHVRRKDWAWLLAARAAHTFFWTNPGLWLLARALRATAEEAADDSVLAAGMRPSDYARELLGVARARHAFGGATVAMVGRGGVGGRVRAILAPRRDRRRATVALGIVVGVGFAALALASGSLTVGMKHLRLDPPPGAQVIRAGDVVRRGSTTLWLDSVFSVDAERVVGWSPSGRMTRSTLKNGWSQVRTGPNGGYIAFQIAAILGDPDDALTFRLPEALDGPSSAIMPDGGTREIRATLTTHLGDDTPFSTDLAVGVASGPWRSVGSTVPLPLELGGPPDIMEGRMRIDFTIPAAAREEDWLTFVTTSQGRRTRADRTYTHFERGAVYARLAKGERVVSIEVQKRSYRWVVFRDVPLVPGPAARATARRPVLEPILPTKDSFMVRGVR